MVKKNELKIGLRIAKKSWINNNIYATITAIGEKNILIKMSNNCIFAAGKERRYCKFEIMKDWKIYDKIDYINKIYKIKKGIVKIIDAYTNDNKDYFIYEYKNEHYCMEQNDFIAEVNSCAQNNFNKMNSYQTLFYALDELIKKGYLKYENGKFNVIE